MKNDGNVPVQPNSSRFLFLQNGSIFDGFGGIEYYLDDLETLCAESFGSENVWAVISRQVPHRNLPAPIYQTSFVSRKTGGIGRRLENRFPFGLFRRARRIIRETRPNLLISGHVGLGPLVLALSRLEKIPFATCVYGIDCWGDLWPQDEACLKAADSIFSISHWTKKILIERGYPEFQIKIIQPRLPTAYENLAFPDRKRDSKQPLTLLTVSRLDVAEQYKGHDHVLQALARLKISAPDVLVKYIIQGDGTDRPRLEQLVVELGLSTSVEFRPAAVHREDFHNVFLEADLYIMPSRFGRWDKRWRGEGFGIVYLEAAAFGLPSIAYRCGGVTDIVRDRVNGILVEPDSIEGLARTILHLAKDRELLNQMGKRAYDIVMTRFTRPAIAKQLAAAVEEYL